MFKRLYFIIFLGVSSSLLAQSNSLKEDNGYGYVQPSFNVTILETIDWLETRLFSLNQGAFSIDTSFRLDEEVSYTASNKPLIKDIDFIDLNISYTLKNMVFDLVMENLLDFSDNAFEIEPEYSNASETVSVFTLQSNSLISLKLTYVF